MLILYVENIAHGVFDRVRITTVSTKVWMIVFYEFSDLVKY